MSRILIAAGALLFAFGLFGVVTFLVLGFAGAKAPGEQAIFTALSCFPAAMAVLGLRAGMSGLALRRPIPPSWSSMALAFCAAALALHWACAAKAIAYVASAAGGTTFSSFVKSWAIPGIVGANLCASLLIGFAMVHFAKLRRAAARALSGEGTLTKGA